jgi:four helix bundle protein
MAVFDVTELRVYQRALNILPSIHKLALQLPREYRSLMMQIIASAQSIPPLLAEGFAKRLSLKEFKRFARMALGSSDETITHAREIYIISKVHFLIDKNLCIQIGKEYKIISKQLNSLIKNWRDYSETKTKSSD